MKDINSWVAKFKDDFGFMPTSLAARTRTAPGSQKRIEVLRQRIAEGKPLFVRGDTSLIPMRESGLDDMGGTIIKGDEHCGAQYSRCGKYQYRLWRRWSTDPTKPIPSIIALHPGEHNHNELDARLRKIMAYCMRFGCAGFDFLSLFGYRSKTWGGVMRSEYPVGDHCDRAIRMSTEQTSFTLCCWGPCGEHQFRAARVLWGLRKRVEAKRLLCFGLTEPELSPVKPIDTIRMKYIGGTPLGCPFVSGETLTGRRLQKCFVARKFKRESRIDYSQLCEIERWVSHPVSIDGVRPSCVAIQLPFSAVDYNDVDCDFDTEEDFGHE